MLQYASFVCMVGKFFHCASQNTLGILTCAVVVQSSTGQTRKSKHMDDFMPSSYARMKLSTCTNFLKMF